MSTRDPPERSLDAAHTWTRIDVTDAEVVEKAIEKVTRDFGSIDDW